MKRLALFAGLVALGLNGCASGVIMMQEPKTGQVFKCERSATSPLWDYNANENCAQALERAGWERL